MRSARTFPSPRLVALEKLSPDTQQGSPDVLVTLQRKALAEIRQVDPDKVIVVSGSFSNSYAANTFRPR